MERFSEDPRGGTGAFSPPVEDPKDHRDPAALLGMREHYALSEALRVLSHWDVGVIHRVREFRRGSRRAPKLRILSERGQYLLKRRAPGRDDLARMRLAHDLIERLAAAGVPVARIVPTREAESAVVLDGRLYELFDYVESTGFPRTPEAAGAAGEVLARLHLVTAGTAPQESIAASSFHAARGVELAFEQIPAAVAAVEGEFDGAELARTCRLLAKGYREAARRAESAGWSGLRQQVIHGDWHPGNVLFRGTEVAAVLDFDSARVEPRIIDVANGVLQFTMLLGTPEDPLGWPEGFDPARIEAFVGGYDRAVRTSERADSGLLPTEQQMLPWLMIEALIAESCVPIAATGSFASIRGSTFLQMIERKVDWLWRRSGRLKRLA